jgi:hypothetical protein
VATKQKPWAWGGLKPGQQQALMFGGVNRGQLLTGKPSFQPFTPYRPPPVPTGSYDPALDAQLGQANRGLGDTRQDIETANARDTVDYGLGQDSINLGYGRTTQDLNTTYGRTTEDLKTGYGRTNADLDTAYSRDQLAHGTALQNLTRQYGILAGQQGEQANAAGVIGGGALLAAAAKRKENQAFDRKPIDTAWQQQQQDISRTRWRAGQDYTTNTGRAKQDYNTGTTRATQDRDLNLGQLALDYAPPSATNPLGGRRFQDRTTTLTRAEREGTAFGLDVNAEKLFQAAQVGYVPPSKGQPGGMPKNESMVNGKPVRTVTVGGFTYVYDDKGRIIRRTPVPSGRKGTVGTGTPSVGGASGFTSGGWGSSFGGWGS